MFAELGFAYFGLLAATVVVVLFLIALELAPFDMRRVSREARFAGLKVERKGIRLL